MPLVTSTLVQDKFCFSLIHYGAINIYVINLYKIQLFLTKIQPKMLIIRIFINLLKI